MRWFVEVSRVGESSIADQYCVEAKQWQAALQEARKLRGDSGALSKFSIELLDRGYRAVDPALKVRYLINEAPADAKLTGDAEPRALVEGPSGKHQPVESVPPTALTTSVLPAAAVPSVVPRPVSLAAPRPNSVSPPRPSSIPAPRALELVIPDDPVPEAPPRPGARSSAPGSARAGLPLYQAVRERGEEPRAESPITYREVAYAVAPGTTRAEVEALLQDRYQATRASIEDHPPGKFVQLAVFDHVFKRRPERPPLATFVWKDWRGDPTSAFPGFGEAGMAPPSQVPPARDSLPPSNVSLPSVSPGASLNSLPLPNSLAKAPAVAAHSIPPDSGALVPMAPVVFALVTPRASLATAEAPVPGPVPAPNVSEPSVPPLAAIEPADLGVAAASLADAVPAAVPAVEAAPTLTPSFELNFESQSLQAAPAVAPTPASAPARSHSPTPDRASRPRLALGRRRAGEDLISELFELMHELNFARDVAAGADFVLSVLNELLPCEGALIHVFDINTSHFVVVRAKGPRASAVLLQRMPDQDPLVTSVMRSQVAVSIQDAAHDPRFNGARWQAVGVAPKLALCGAVKQGGRYLGLIELVNPQGDAPFHPSELNALDYICQQFAAFLSSKPIVLTADVVLARS